MAEKLNEHSNGPDKQASDKPKSARRKYVYGPTQPECLRTRNNPKTQEDAMTLSLKVQITVGSRIICDADHTTSVPLNPGLKDRGVIAEMVQSLTRNAQLHIMAQIAHYLEQNSDFSVHEKTIDVPTRPVVDMAQVESALREEEKPLEDDYPEILPGPPEQSGNKVPSA